jgi:PAS domain S-box-containing protein
MPGMDGFETCQKLKENKVTHDIPVIFMSALKDTVDKLKGFEAGGIDYITKPFDVSEVLARINLHLSIRSIQNQLKVSNKQLIAAQDELQKLNSELEDRIQQRTVQLENSNKALRVSEEHFRTIAENLPNSYLSIIEKDLRVGFTSGQEFQKLGLDSESFIGLTLEEVFGNQVKEVRRYYLDTFKGKETTFELYINNQYQLYKTVPLFDENGKIQRIMAVVENITERKLAEEELIKLSTAVTQSPSVIAITDLRGNLEYINPKFTELTGYTSEEVIGRNPRILKSGKLPDDVYKELWNTISSGKEWHGEFYNKKKNGDFFWEAASISPIFDKQRKIINYIKIAENITERKHMEEQIKKDLKEKSTLLQELYHRTKNNMQIISSLLMMQSQCSDSEFVHTTFKEIINKINAMSLVHQKLYQAKDLSHINLKEYIEDIIRLLMQSYSVQSEVISLKLDLKDVFVLIDSAIPCGLILNELITNVIKHAFPNNAKGEISLQLYKEDNGQINIYVCDNGVGVPGDFNLEDITTMGLQTVFALSEYQLQGHITCESENGLKCHLSFKDDLYKKRV